MKASEIQVGKCYGNGKGQIRQVTQIQAHPYYPRASDVYYMETEAGKIFGPIFMSSFAAWAKEEVGCP